MAQVRSFTAYLMDSRLCLSKWVNKGSVTKGWVYHYKPRVIKSSINHVRPTIKESLSTSRNKKKRSDMDLQRLPNPVNNKWETWYRGIQFRVNQSLRGQGIRCRNNPFPIDSEGFSPTGGVLELMMRCDKWRARLLKRSREAIRFSCHRTKHNRWFIERLHDHQPLRIDCRRSFSIHYNSVQFMTRVEQEQSDEQLFILTDKIEITLFFF